MWLCVMCQMGVSCSQSYCEALSLQVGFQFWNIYFPEVEYAGCQGGIGMPYGEGIAEMFHSSGTAAGYDGDGQVVGKVCQGFVGEAFLHTVVVHGGEQYFACSPLLCLVRPVKQPQFLSLASSFGIAVPSIAVQSRVYGAYYYLRPEMACYFVYERRRVDGSRIDAYLVGTGIQQPIHITEFLYATAHGEGDVYG